MIFSVISIAGVQMMGILGDIQKTRTDIKIEIKDINKELLEYIKIGIKEGISSLKIEAKKRLILWL